MSGTVYVLLCEDGKGRFSTTAESEKVARSEAADYFEVPRREVIVDESYSRNYYNE